MKTSLGSYSDKERLDHAVGFPVLRVAAVTVDGRLDDSHNVVTKIQLKSEQHGRTHLDNNQCSNSSSVLYQFKSKFIGIQTVGHVITQANYCLSNQ